MRGNKQFVADDLNFICISRYGFTHDLTPGIFDLHGLDGSFDPAALEELFQGFRYGVFAHGSKVGKTGKTESREEHTCVLGAAHC